MRQIRKSVFETNSSSTHAISLTGDYVYNGIKSKELLMKPKYVSLLDSNWDVGRYQYFILGLEPVLADPDSFDTTRPIYSKAYEKATLLWTYIQQNNLTDICLLNYMEVMNELFDCNVKNECKSWNKVLTKDEKTDPSNYYMFLWSTPTFLSKLKKEFRNLQLYFAEEDFKSDNIWHIEDDNEKDYILFVDLSVYGKNEDEIIDNLVLSHEDYSNIYHTVGWLNVKNSMFRNVNFNEDSDLYEIITGSQMPYRKIRKDPDSEHVPLYNIPYKLSNEPEKGEIREWGIYSEHSLLEHEESDWNGTNIFKKILEDKKLLKKVLYNNNISINAIMIG